MNENRVYSKKINIDTDHTRDFYDDRARRLENMESPYTAVLLGDQSPNRAVEWDNYEKKFLISQIKFDSSDNIMDIGCGIGRLAEILIPICRSYTGIDFSSEMIKAADKRMKSTENNNYKFINASFYDIVSDSEQLIDKFNKIIIAGVCMYINDDELDQCYQNLLGCVEQNCVIYIEDTVSLETRLTLDGVHSQALKSDYDAIYRTRDEYNDLFKVFLENGFKIVDQDFFPDFDGKESFKETDHWYTILKR